MAEASPGVRPLARRMRLAGVLLLTLSAATPASSLFVIVPDVLRQAGTGALIAMGLAALAAAAVSQVYAELSSAFPYAGGEYAIVARTLGPEAGFAVLAVNLLNSVLTAAVFALGVCDFLREAWPPASTFAVAMGVIAVAGGVGLLDIRAGGWVTGAFLGVELLAVAAVAAAGFLHPERALGSMLAHPQALSGAALAPASWGAVAMAASVALFAYDGYGSAVYFAEELERPRERVGRAVTWALAIVLVAEIVPVAAVLVGAPSLARLFASASPMEALVGARLGAGARAAAALAVALAVGNAVIALVMLSARQIYALARDGVWPGRRLNLVLGATGPNSNVPTAGALAATAAAAILCLLPLKLLLILTGAGITVIYAALCLALLVGRARGRLDGARWRAPLFPWLPLGGFAALAAVLAADLLDPAEGRPSLLITFAVALVGAGWGAWASRRGGWTLRAPRDDQA